MTSRSTAIGEASPISPVYRSHLHEGGCDDVRAAGGGVGTGDGEVLMDDVVEDGEIIEATELDSDPIKVAPSPYTPTQQDIDEHNVDHIPPTQLVPLLCQRLWA